MKKITTLHSLFQNMQGNSSIFIRSLFFEIFFDRSREHITLYIHIWPESKNVNYFLSRVCHMKLEISCEATVLFSKFPFYFLDNFLF